MEEEQLNGLALLNVHRDKEVPSDKIIEDFCENESSATKSSFIILERSDYNLAESGLPGAISEKKLNSVRKNAKSAKKSQILY